jgi:hypothetical protein
MSASGYTDHSPVQTGTVIEVDNATSAGLAGWETEDPCKYVGQSCRGRMFTSLTNCRRRREKSEALCEAQRKANEQKAENHRREQELLEATRQSVIQTGQQQQTANKTMMIGLGIGATTLIVVGGAMALKSRKSKK